MTNMTAVEFLIEQFKIYLPSIHQKGLQDTFEQALEMEKQQITDAYIMGSYDMADKQFKPEQYYSETYKSDKK